MEPNVASATAGLNADDLRLAIPQIDMRGVSKAFGPTRALIDVSMTVHRGEARALLGRNGAGKSTLMGALTGTLHPDQGQILIAGVPVRDVKSVSCVYQHSRLVPEMTVAENIMYRNCPTGRFGHINWNGVAAEARRQLEPWNLGHLADVPVRDLDSVPRKVVEICRALAQKPQVLLLDEPTAGLDREDAERLFKFIDRLKQQKVTLVYVSHHLDEVYRICDTATVLRDARHIVTASLGELPKKALIEAMVGTRNDIDFSQEARRKLVAGLDRRLETAKASLSVQGLSVDGIVEDFSIDVRHGECVGIAGLEGSGKAEIGSALAGLVPRARGTVNIDGKRLRLGDTRTAIRSGIGYVPENRHEQGMVLSMSVSDNATLAATRSIARPLIPKLLSILVPSDCRRIFDALARQWRIVCSGPDQPISELSGGNQQKCVMARALAAKPKVLVLQNPTAGVDVQAKGSILESLRSFLEEGGAVLVISEDSDDFYLASRILVVNRGRKGVEFGVEWSDGDLVKAMQGGAN